MTTIINTVEVQPDARRMIEGLRDTGYKFNTAMADIIDNSIAAGATLVDIRIIMDYIGDITIYIADNGSGMDEEGLINAMRYGSNERPDPGSLGKFGLGLKTASTAFCRSLSVTSRSAGNGTVLKARWDLDHVSIQKWNLLFLNPDQEEMKLLADVTEGGAGTIVTWEKVDRVLKTYSEQGGTYARRALERIQESLADHISMVYQRFLDPSYTDANNVIIRLNEKAIEAWDPFCSQEPYTEVVAERRQEVELPDAQTTTSFFIKAYVIPRKEQFSSEEEAKKAKLTNDRQGFYVYRENRLIHYGDWLGMFRNEPHGTLLRVEFSFDHTLDDAFNVDIKKSNILLNDDLYNWLKDQFLPAPRRAADDRYRKGVNKGVGKAAKGAHDGSNAGIGSKEKAVQMANIEVTDEENNEVEVTNKKGRFKIKLPLIESAKEGEVHVTAVDSVDDGLLWEPCLIDKHHAVRINTSHPYYHKVYVPNLLSGVTIQGMDSLLWAMCEAELGTINDDTKYYIKELRYEVSKLLRKLVEDLPEPDINNGD
ncbi:ATP-binding protein [Cohnella phaseoli]|uniref:Histidine kinase/DNA gyrase B/HSP90-like ATPase n=1 Tax=Cohnella phaseoli TaxID=456490 RepID=A0A3D9I856_9BACL|nr:ATP-binding protein [Cohnella phaseoli]RED57943.1 histidine kinase/DNA gyrase B/HSP90-like ATPase [Cohnella phaseoli]